MVGDTHDTEDMDPEEYQRFFGNSHVLEGETSIENCLKIFDEKQALVLVFMAKRESEELLKAQQATQQANMTVVAQ